jgi:hypothetical protein
LAKNKNSKRKPILKPYCANVFFGGKRSPNGKSKNGCATCKQEMKNKKEKKSSKTRACNNNVVTL